MLWAETPDANNNATQDLTADLDTTTVTAGNQEGQVLVRFDNLFGSAAGQIPAGALIHSAKLVLNTPDNITGSSYDSTSTYRAHRMIMDWTDTATWNSLTAGVSNNNTEAATTATYSLAPSVAGGPAIYDVTADLELFQSGTLNRGWLLRASTASPDDGWTMKSSEYATDVTLRPSLDVTYSLPGNTYTTWAASSGLTAANNAALLDPDHDGVLNLHEFAFNLNPLLPDATTLTPAGTKGLPAGALVPVTGGKSLEVTFLRRKAPTGTGLAYTAQFSPNLSTWSAGLTPTVTALSTDWERVTVRDSAAVGQPRRFGRVSVTFTP